MAHATITLAAMSRPRPHASRLVRLTCIFVGIFALALGLIGIVVPVLPTTPFVLLAAACFARGSARLHDAMIGHRIAGPIIHEWQTHRAMPRRVKRVAYGLMLLSFGGSLLMMPTHWHRLLLGGLGLLLLFFLWRVPVREIEPNVFATPPESPQ
jgi:uncharacterized membrane protein YbaN (DUF454 family)